ncbi:MAG: ribosome recycling factor [Deltaproteobacteria bacterium]|nr:ribosome recycling factor [Deltaproteobacteria bacterium]
MIDEIFEDMKERMEKTIVTLDRDLKRVRTGRASVALLDGIRVDYYGTPTPLNQLASVSVPEARQLLIQPWDLKVLGDIEKSILKSDLGLTPMNDGKLIRINIPPLSEQRRKDLVKVVRKKAEENKVAVRNIRRDANEMLKDLKKEKQISEDDLAKAQEDVQKKTDDFIKKVDEVTETKVKEIMEF